MSMAVRLRARLRGGAVLPEGQSTGDAGPDFRFVDGNDGLADLCQRARRSSVLSMDTEFVREDTYFPIPALLQFNVDGDVFLCDPLTVDDFAPLRALFEDSSVAIVMHSCSEDMEVFRTLLDSYPTPLFDTQVAAAFCGYGFSLSYQRLVEMLTGEALEKTETRSNWLQRPLTDKQCHYAADDVRWLPMLHQQLQQRLGELGRESWCAEDCARIVEQSRNGVSDDQQYLRIRAAARLAPESRARLRTLCSWREREARALNLPKGRIFNDVSLADAAERMPSTIREVASLEKVRQSSVRRYGQALLDCLKSADQQDHPMELPGIGERGDRSRRELLRKLQAKTRAVAEEHDIPVEVLGKKRDLEQFIEARDSSVIATGWRAPLLAGELATLCDEA